MISITQKTGRFSSRLVIDLEKHLNAYKKGTDKELRDSHMELANEVAICQITFEMLVTQALEREDLADYHIVVNSPAYHYVKREFAEILKNAIDSKLQQQEKLGEHNHNAILLLDIKIDIDKNNNNIRFVISDNGMGFPDRKLSLFQNRELRESSDYYTHVGSDKYSSSEDSDLEGRKLVMGGAGRGIREMIGLADKGNANYGQGRSYDFSDSDNEDMMCDNVENRTFDLPRVSELQFYNKDNGNGAVIDIITSQEPIVFHEIKTVETVTLVLPDKIRFKRGSHESPKSITKELGSETNSDVDSDEGCAKHFKNI